MFRIGDMNVNRLSGPVSFKYLVPREDVFREMADRGIFLPIIILLGDQHFSEKNLCERCDEQKGCYQVESDTFLSTLNNLASRYPIDFFTEYSSNKRPTTIGILFRKFLEKTSHCHNRVSKRALCDYPYIRWHYADARFWSKDKIEIVVPKTIKYLGELKENKFVRVSVPDGMGLFQKFMKAIIEFIIREKNFSELSFRLSHIINTELSGNRLSIVYKQLSKLGIDDISIGLYCEYSLKYHHLSTPTKVGDIYNSKDLMAIYKLIFEGKEIDYSKLSQYNNLIDRIEEFWVKYTSCILDLYLLGRMLKTPRNNINSYLTVAFLGHSHSGAISNFLDEFLGWYETKLERNFINEDRCIAITKGADFNRDLQEYSEARMSLQDISEWNRY
jgi:hypothetical protein